MSTDVAADLGLWLSKLLLEGTESSTQELVLIDVEEKLEEGVSFDDAIRSVSTHSARSGDFGMEIVGSMLAVVVAEALKSFWSAYMKEIEKRMAVKATDLTLGYLKKMFATDLSGAKGQEFRNTISAELTLSASKRGVKPEQIKECLRSLDTLDITKTFEEE